MSNEQRAMSPGKLRTWEAIRPAHFGISLAGAFSDIAWKFAVVAVASMFLPGCSISLTIREPVALEQLRKEGYVTLPRAVELPRGERYDCGPESAVAVLAFWGIDASLEEAVRALRTEKYDGTPMTALAPYLRRKGLIVETVEGSLGMIKNTVDAGRTSIIMLEVASQPRILGNPFRPGLVFHFFCVVGYHDGARKVLCSAPERCWFEIDYATLLEYWKRTEFLFLAVRAPGTEDEFLLGRDAVLSGDHTRGVAHFRKALALDGNHLLSLIGLGTSLEALGQPRDALEVYVRAKALAPDNPHVLNNLANLYCELGEKADEAPALAERSVMLYRNEVAELKRQLTALPAVDARESAQRALKEKEIALAYALGTLGRIRSKKGDHLGAIASWEAALATIPLGMADLRAQRLLDVGSARRDLRDFRAAKESLNHALNVVKDPALKARIEERLKSIP